jgi:hypothetical protein
MSTLAVNREIVEAQIEALCKSLDGLAHSKKVNTAAQIQGGSEQLLWVMNGSSGGGAGSYGPRIERALARVTQEPPPPPITISTQGSLADPEPEPVSPPQRV